MIIGAAIGAIGSIINQGIQIYRDRQQATIDEKKRSDEYAMAQINAGKDAIVASFTHDAAIGEGVSQWVANVRALIRPLLTLYPLTIVSIFYYSATQEDKAIIIASTVEFTTMAGTWWFADRFKK